jgi:outer membrane protein assembly factor BamB
VAYVDSSPAVAGGTVYVGNDDGKVHALDAATGHLRWA